MLNKRFEDEGAGETVKVMIENDGKSATYRALREVLGRDEAVRMMVGKDGRATLSELAEFMSTDEAREYIAIFEQED